MKICRIRRVLAIVCFAVVTALFLDFTGTVHLWFGWLAKIQFMPAVLAINITVIILLVLLTLLFGRVYCSVICPLGVWQDGVSNIAGRRKKNRLRHSPAKSWLRYSLLGLLAVAVILGGNAAAALLDPYAAYGRMASNLAAPLYHMGNSLLNWFAERINSYAFYPTAVWVKGWITFGTAAVTLAVVGLLAWRNGRTYCNTVCPVGTVLGFLSRFSLFKPVIDVEKCKQCGLCERNCKASCINVKNLTIDASRCVACFNCIEKCNFGAMKYAPVNIRRKKHRKNETAGTGGGMSRRGFVSIAGVFALTQTVSAQQLRVDGGLAEIQDKKIPKRKTPIVPPGATGLRNMNSRCTACQLCVSVCPNNVLRPSAKLATLMQPEMSYEKGYCRPECTKCSEVCPAGAIRPVSPADKSAISIGKAVWIKENCVVNRDEIQCHSCADNCPTGAITLMAIHPEDKSALQLPVIDKERCIGCGACENLCPARPFSAVYVEGNVVHHSV
jgi:ferredoxin